MSLTAAIKFVQGMNVGTAGIALLAVNGQGTTVVASNGDNSHVVRWKWTMLAVPGGSTVPIGVMSDGSFSTATWNYDVAGCYHLELIATDQSGNQVRDRRVFGVKETSGRVIPPFDAEAPAMNFDGQLRGWAKYLEEYLRAVDAGGGGGGGLPITSNGLTALDDFDVGGGDRNLVVGDDGTLNPGVKYKYVSVLAKTAIDWSVNGTATMVTAATGTTVVNDTYLGFLALADPVTLPTVGKIRFEYNGGAAVPLLVVVDNVGGDQAIVKFGAANLIDFGNVNLQARLFGFQGALVDLNADITVTPGSAGYFTVNGATQLLQEPISALDVDWEQANYFYKTLDMGGNTFTFSNLPSGKAAQVTLVFTSDAGGSTVTWPGGVKWAGGAAPTQTSPSGVDVYTFVQINGVVYGNAVQAFA